MYKAAILPPLFWRDVKYIIIMASKKLYKVIKFSYGKSALFYMRENKDFIKTAFLKKLEFRNENSKT